MDEELTEIEKAVALAGEFPAVGVDTLMYRTEHGLLRTEEEEDDAD